MVDAALDPMSGDVADHEADRAVGQDECVVPVTADLCAELGGQIPTSASDGSGDGQQVRKDGGLEHLCGPTLALEGTRALDRLGALACDRIEEVAVTRSELPRFEPRHRQRPDRDALGEEGEVCERLPPCRRDGVVQVGILFPKGRRRLVELGLSGADDGGDGCTRRQWYPSPGSSRLVQQRIGGHEFEMSADVVEQRDAGNIGAKGPRSRALHDARHILFRHGTCEARGDLLELLASFDRDLQALRTVEVFPLTGDLCVDVAKEDREAIGPRDEVEIEPAVERAKVLT